MTERLRPGAGARTCWSSWRSATSGSSPSCALCSGAGMTVVTGETGAGKTLVVDAIELLVGGRADPALVRTGAEEAWVEGRFVAAARARHCRRPRRGRDRPGHPALRPQPRLRRRPPRDRHRAGRRSAPSLVDLHGQHAHQSLLHPPPSAPPSTGSPASTWRRCGRRGSRSTTCSTSWAALGRRRAGPGPRARPAPLPGRGDRRGRHRRTRRGRAPRDRRGRARRRHGPPRGRSARASPLSAVTATRPVDGPPRRRRRRRGGRGARRAGTVRRRRGAAARARGRADRRGRRAAGRRRDDRRGPRTARSGARSGGTCCASCGASTARRWPT